MNAIVEGSGHFPSPSHPDKQVMFLKEAKPDRRTHQQRAIYSLKLTLENGGHSIHMGFLEPPTSYAAISCLKQMKMPKELKKNFSDLLRLWNDNKGKGVQTLSYANRVIGHAIVTEGKVFIRINHG